jgi:hypothetical protein
VALDVLAWRATDGFTRTFPPFTGGTATGQWRPTPPAFLSMVQMQFAFMDPFVVSSLDQFLPGKPRGLNTNTWVSDYNEVKQIASNTSTTRTADQTSIGWFWAGVGWAHWSEAALALAVANHSTRETTSRLFAQMAAAGADTIETTWHGKLLYAEDPTPHGSTRSNSGSPKSSARSSPDASYLRADLARKLRRYINAYSANAQPINWKYSDPSHRIRSNELSATRH